MARSAQQEAVINYSIVAGGHLIVRALAGCGKSYTLIEVVKEVVARDPGAEISVVAYNKDITAEMQAKLNVLGNRNVRAMTMHSAGLAAIRAYLQRMKNVQIKDASNKKIDSIVDDLQVECLSWTTRPGLSPEKIKEAQDKAEICANQRGFVTKAVSLAKQRAFGVVHPVDQMDKWYELIEHFGLDEDWEELEYQHSESMIRLCILVYNRSLDQILQGIIDFDDMIIGPLFYRCKFWAKAFVLVDEVQDLNLSRRLLAIRMAGSTGRIIGVGDHNQAIYGFTGADSDSMDQLRDALGAVELPLTMTYRCPKAVVREAQRWVPEFQAHEANPEGMVRTIPLLSLKDTEGKKFSADFEDETLTHEDSILCRNTKPLVEMAWSLIRRGIACRVEGREIGQGLISMARRWKAVRLDSFKNRVQTWKDREVAKYRTKGREDMIQGVEDKSDTIVCIIDSLMADGKHNVSDFETFVTSLFGDSKEGEVQRVLTLSTVHKSKGREWKRVFILGMNKYMPSRYAKKEWQKQQEINLMYVAVTRSMNELVYINVD